MSVFQDFSDFCDNLTVNNRPAISSRYKAITRRLNLDFHESSSDQEHSLYVGSYGRNTAVRGFSDLDMLFVLPHKLYKQYNDHVGNGQSALLQKVRNSLRKTYPNTDIGGDGQVVVISFSDSMIFEIVPCFLLSDDRYKYPDSNHGGQWKITNPKPEIAAINGSSYSENLKWLCRMTRAWKRNNNVSMGGLLIDTLAYRFLDNCEYKDKGKTYYDWICRDFFEYLSKEDTEKKYWYAVGSKQLIYRKGYFEYKAKKAYLKSLEAIEYQQKEYWYSAKLLWREIFGNSFPR